MLILILNSILCFYLYSIITLFVVGHTIQLAGMDFISPQASLSLSLSISLPPLRYYYSVIILIWFCARNRGGIVHLFRTPPAKNKQTNNKTTYKGIQFEHRIENKFLQFRLKTCIQNSTLI